MQSGTNICACIWNWESSQNVQYGFWGIEWPHLKFDRLSENAGHHCQYSVLAEIWIFLVNHTKRKSINVFPLFLRKKNPYTMFCLHKSPLPPPTHNHTHLFHGGAVSYWGGGSKPQTNIFQGQKNCSEASDQSSIHPDTVWNGGQLDLDREVLSRACDIFYLSTWPSQSLPLNMEVQLNHPDSQVQTDPSSTNLSNLLSQKSC